jgi:predicted RNase H-like HicB family nuclease
LDELLQNMREVIELCLEELSERDLLPEFVGVQKVIVSCRGCPFYEQMNLSNY